MSFVGHVPASKRNSICRHSGILLGGEDNGASQTVANEFSFASPTAISDKVRINFPTDTQNNTKNMKSHKMTAQGILRCSIYCAFYPIRDPARTTKPDANLARPQKADFSPKLIAVKWHRLWSMMRAVRCGYPGGPIRIGGLFVAGHENGRRNRRDALFNPGPDRLQLSKTIFGAARSPPSL
ncbi:hypothetical protein [Stappia stellulata]|uniref:hypothetical protein n=1 Tax=Stappia stellulata TaxID=71235 RepID=UPI0012EB8EC4|nr:hypothetical protein [Stappia stellulata]